MQNLKPTLYGHQLALKIIFNHAINPADRIESTPKVISDKFKADVMIRCKKKALKEARKA